jgi:hypothetical protein
LSIDAVVDDAVVDNERPGQTAGHSPFEAIRRDTWSSGRTNVPWAIREPILASDSGDCDPERPPNWQQACLASSVVDTRNYYALQGRPDPARDFASYIYDMLGSANKKDLTSIPIPPDLARLRATPKLALHARISFEA